ncbi:MAG: chemotaxis protein CheD [Clostridiales bacterium]|jgi:chemotaxis protein CheD|nr:chemotaxis protein CheD [Clostridiales bacterium]
MADLKVTKEPSSMLTTLGLGSCVGIALYDAQSKVAGLAHIMLPDSTQIQNNKNIAKFADTALKKMISDMLLLGANKSLLKAKIAGGAQMFAFESLNPGMRIGERNIEAVRRQLKLYNIPILGQDVGLNYGRTVELYVNDGSFLIKTIGHGNKTV